MKSRTKGAGRTAGLMLLAMASMTAPAGAQIPETVKAPYVAPSDQAKVVFSRERRRQASQVTLRIVSQAGRCLAELNNGWQMVTTMWPGKHMVMVVTGTAPPTVQLMELRLSAGKTYVVNLRTRVNTKSPVEIGIVRRDDQPLEAFPPAVSERTEVETDLRQCTEWVSWKRAKIEPRAEQAKQKWDKEEADGHRSEHTLHRNDGWTATEVSTP